MRVFVTGGHGFVGRTLIRRLNNVGAYVYSPTSTELDLRHAGNLDELREAFDLVFHLAAWTQAGDWCLTHPGEQWLINQQVNTNVLAWWMRHSPQAKMVTVGTSCSYSPDHSLSEENYLKGEPIASLYTYAMTKRMLLQGLQALEAQYNVSYLYAVPNTLYGPGYHNDGRQPHFIFDLVRKILRGVKFQDPIVLWGDGFQRREIVHVQDFVENLLGLVSVGETGIFNLGAGSDASIRQYADMICELVGCDPLQVHYDETRYVGAKSKLLDSSKTQHLLGTHFAARPLKIGLSELVTWESNNFLS